MKKTLFCVFLVLVLLMSLLAGCSGSGTTQTAAEPAQTSEAPAAAQESAAETAAPVQEPEPTEAQEPEPADEAEPAPEAPEPETPAQEAPPAEGPAQEPEVVEPAYTVSYPLVEDRLVLTYWKNWPPFLNGYDSSDASMFNWLEEKTNVAVDIQQVGTETATEKFNLMVASGDYPDLLENAGNAYTGGYTAAIADEVVLDLMPFMEEFAPDYWAVIQGDIVALATLVDADGQMGGMCSMYDAYPRGSAGMWIRTDWLEAQGLEKPRTVEELETVLQTFKDVYGCSDAIAVRDTSTIEIQSAFDTKGWFIDENGQVEYGMTIPRYVEGFREYLATEADWYQKGFFSSDFITYNDTSMPLSTMLINGMTGLVSSDIMLISELGVLNTPEGFTLEALAPITANPDDKMPRGWSSRMYSSAQASVSTDCLTPEIAVSFINAAFTEEALLPCNWGTEGLTYEVDENGEPHFTDYILNNPNIAASFAPLAFINPGFPALKSYAMSVSSYNYPAQVSCFDIFDSKTDYDTLSDSYPSNYVAFTTEESEIIRRWQTDLETYSDECMPKFITGLMNLEGDYDAYVAQVLAFGYEDLKSVYQSAYDRFIGAVGD